MRDLTPVILAPELSERVDPAQSILALPVGTETLLDMVVSKLLELSESNTILVASSATSPCFRKISPQTAKAVRVIDPSQLSSRAATADASDFYLLIDPRFWPHGGPDFAGLLRHADSYRGSTHAVSIAHLRGGAQERVECDEDGRIRCVRRVYGDRNWADNSRARICCSLVPVRAIADQQFTSLRDLRVKLIGRGLLNQDAPMASDVFDLHVADDLLCFSEQVIKQTLAKALPSGFQRSSEGIVGGADVQVHPSALLVPPIILQAGVIIEEGVRLIGPTVIGARSRIQRNVTVVRSLVAQDTNLDPDTQLYQSLPEMGEVTEGYSLGRETADLSETGREATPALVRWHWFAKRGLDLFVAGILLVCLSPLLLLLAIVVKLSSPGPVFFAHRREKRGGVDFPCIKFRTMEAKAHAKQRELYQKNQVDGPQFKLQDDPRVTRVGRFLRTTNLDELPQLINVFLGHMSLVGPRPSPFRENQICVPWRCARLSVPPGITGIWQLCRDKRWSDGDFHQWIFYDMAYIRHFSFWLDLKILMYTVLTMGGRRHLPLERLIPVNPDHSRSEGLRSPVAVN